jgi:tricorn protease
MRGPLSEPGLDVKQGNYLLAVNGHELKVPSTPDELLAGITTEVTLSIGSNPYGPRRDIRVAPLSEDMRRRRHDWIEYNRAEVDRLSGGRLGYVFVTNFGAEGEADFVRQFYPQRERDGLIFDVRWNGGGLTSQWVLDVLRREVAGVFVNREDALSTLPTAVGPRTMVALANYASASDGDQFPFFFEKFHLGKVVGEPTWGGVQGINRDWTLMDGTSFTIPKDALASVEGQWIIENAGVEPSIAVSSAPEERIMCKDRQLETTIATALDELRAKPPLKLRAPRPLPAYPCARRQLHQQLIGSLASAWTRSIVGVKASEVSGYHR